jgi:hypothetical protein
MLSSGHAGGGADAGGVWDGGVRVGEEGFFFVKKKQKTFAHPGHGLVQRHRPSEKKFFCFFFYKKRSPYFTPSS